MKEYFLPLMEQYGPIGIIVLLTLEFIALPVPGEPLMTTLGIADRMNGSSVWISFICAIIGTNLGSIIAFWIGHIIGEKVLHKYGKYVFITEEKIQKTHALLEKYKVVILIFNRYIPGVRHVVPYLCGIGEMKLKEFMKYSLLGSIIWCGSFIFGGYFIGKNVEKWIAEWEGYFHKYSWQILISVILLVAIGKGIHWININRVKKKTS